MRIAQAFLADERGLESVEYAVLAGLMVAGLLAIVLSIGKWSKDHMGALSRRLNGA